jgi:hypothetical protein
VTRRFLLASGCLLACSVELAPAEREPGPGENDASTGGSAGFFAGGSGGAGQEGGSGGIAGGGFGGAVGGSGGLGGYPVGGAGGTGAVSGGGSGGTGSGGGAPFQCVNVYLIDGDLNGSPGGCDFPDPIDCYCQDCYDQCEPAPGVFSDCICPSCWNDMDICGPDVCATDGFCDPFNEGCICPDCYLHPSCP